MNWLIFWLIMGTSEVEQATTQSPSKEHDNEKTQQKDNDHIQPDMELLLFLAEWDDGEHDQWMDPSIFAEDSQFNQQLDNNKATSNEKDPDHH